MKFEDTKDVPFSLWHALRILQIVVYFFVDRRERENFYYNISEALDIEGFNAEA